MTKLLFVDCLSELQLDNLLVTSILVYRRNPLMEGESWMESGLTWYSDLDSTWNFTMGNSGYHSQLSPYQFNSGGISARTVCTRAWQSLTSLFEPSSVQVFSANISPYIVQGEQLLTIINIMKCTIGCIFSWLIKL